MPRKKNPAAARVQPQSPVISHVDDMARQAVMDMRRRIEALEEGLREADNDVTLARAQNARLTEQLGNLAHGANYAKELLDRDKENKRAAEAQVRKMELERTQWANRFIRLSEDMRGFFIPLVSAHEGIHMVAVLGKQNGVADPTDQQVLKAIHEHLFKMVTTCPPKPMAVPGE